MALTVVITIALLVLSVGIIGSYFKFPRPTFGGRRLWTDLRIQNSWRVQRHVRTGKCRLLDEKDWQWHVGDEASQIGAMNQNIQEGAIAASRPHAVVLVHGLGRSNHCLFALARTFKKQGYEVIDFNYASNQATIEIHAASLNRCLDALHGVETVHFVTHSLGGIVLRKAFAERSNWNEQLKLGRAVLITAPNQGSAVARILCGYTLLNSLFGPPLRQLSDPHLGEFSPLPLPFATIGATVNYLPLLKGENDTLVTVEESKLKGAEQHLTVKASHAFVMSNKQVITFVCDFLGTH